MVNYDISSLNSLDSNYEYLGVPISGCTDPHHDCKKLEEGYCCVDRFSHIQKCIGTVHSNDNTCGGDPQDNEIYAQNYPKYNRDIRKSLYPSWYLASSNQYKIKLAFLIACGLTILIIYLFIYTLMSWKVKK
jgi:hypothetical protein